MNSTAPVPRTARGEEKPDANPEANPEESVRQELWGRLSSPQSREEFFSSWLRLLASMRAENFSRLLLAGISPEGAFQPLALWPEGDRVPDVLAGIAGQAMEEECGLVHRIEEAGADFYAVAYPVHVGEDLRYVVAGEVRARDETTLAGCMEQIQWGTAWLEAVSRRLAAHDDRWRLERLTRSIDLLAQVLDASAFDTAAMAMVTEVARQMRCERVSFGLQKGKQVAVRALSHSARFGERMNLIRAIGAAMDEAVLQNRPLVYPEPEGPREHLICREHEVLARDFGAANILTLPLFNGTNYYGAVTLERSSTEPFSREEVEVCRDLASLAGAALHLQWRNDRPLAVKIGEACRQECRRLFGPRHLARKLVLGGVVGLGLFFGFARGDYRLSADTVLEGAVRRKVVAPYDGYIAETMARAGDVVADGEVLCRLDDRDLLLERLNWASQHNQLQKQRQEALAAHDRAEVNILAAKLDQSEAQLELIETKLARTRLKAPFRGQVTSGDLTQRLGGAVEQGEVLFEVAPLDAYRLILKVDERRIADLQVGQTGELVLTSLPQEHFPFTISKLTPITTTEEGRNFFRVEARLAGHQDSLRPGMEGVGKVMIDRRNLLGIWTREMRDWLTLWLWSWWP